MDKNFDLEQAVVSLKENGVSLEELVTAFVSNETDKMATFSSEIIRKMKKRWKEVYGVDVEIPPIPYSFTPKVIENYKILGMEFIYIPALNSGTLAELRRIGVDEYLKKLQRCYPEWHRYESLDGFQKRDHSISRNLREWYWECVKDGRIPFEKLSGQWIAVETMLKPNCGHEYPSSEMNNILGIDSRFGHSLIKINEFFNEKREEILSALGLTDGDVRLLTALEWNLLANFYGWGKTNTYELTNTKLLDDGVSGRVIVGRSVDGGAASADWVSPEDSYDFLGFRFAIVL